MGVTSEERAKKSIAFAKQYRTYVINYGLGEEMVAQMSSGSALRRRAGGGSSN